MSNRSFHLRLKSTYKTPDNSVAELTVEVEKDQQWEALDLSIRSAGFLLFINGLFSCQHLYMRTNSAERNLLLDSATGDMQLTTNENWQIQAASIAFVAKLQSGSPSADDIHYITERMTHCPVSSNLPKHIQIQNSVVFE